MSNNWLFNTAIFAVGAVVGSVATWKYLKTKYEQLAQEEIESVREVYERHTAELEKQSSESESEKDEIMKAYQDIIDGYVEVERPGPVKSTKKPEVISPEELGEIDYEVCSLTYYADNVLAYDDGEVIENVEEVVGEDALNCFGQFEDDSVHVRNHSRRVDYEILARVDKYSDVWFDPNERDLNKNPRFVEDE